MDMELKQMLQEIAEEYHFQILAMEVMPDHISDVPPADCRGAQKKYVMLSMTRASQQER